MPDQYDLTLGHEPMDELASRFYEHILLPLIRYQEIKNDGVIGSDRDLRAALDVATALYHLREHVPPPHQKSRRTIATVCPDYDLLGDVVNASKHATLSQGTPQVSSADDIFQIQVTTKYKDELGEYTHDEKLVVIKLLDGTERDLFDVLIAVHDFWVQELTSIAAKPANHSFSISKKGLLSRDEAKRVQLQMTQGVRWRQKIRFQEYNYATGTIDPVDLRDAKDITFSLREPPQCGPTEIGWVP